MPVKKKEKHMLAPTVVTGEQIKWLLSESARTGNSMASIIRSLVQEKIEDSK